MQREKRMKKESEKNIQELWEKFKWYNICVFKIPGGE